MCVVRGAVEGIGGLPLLVGGLGGGERVARALIRPCRLRVVC